MLEKYSSLCKKQQKKIKSQDKGSRYTKFAARKGIKYVKAKTSFIEENI